MANAKPTFQAVVLAAGKSSRFKSDTTKLLFTLCGQEMLLYPLTLLQECDIPTTLVVGYKKELIKKFIEDKALELISFVEQAQQRGTGDAVAAALHTWYADHIIILNGDAPLITLALLKEVIDKHLTSNATVTFVAAHNTDPESSAGYGRFVVEDGITTVREARDFQGDPLTHCYVNAAIYVVKRDFLKKHISLLATHENTQELYFPDIIEIASRKQLPVTMVVAPFDLIRGVNTLQELWAAEQIKRAELIKYWMSQGVQFTYAQSTHIDYYVTIGAGTKIEAGVQILGKTRIGKHCRLGAYSTVSNSAIDDRTVIHGHSIVTDATVSSDAIIGPFAYIHRNCLIDSGSTVGNFVEVSRSSIGQGSKVKHLSYIGNAQIGSHVNVGAGTIVCNYNGLTKNTTIIHDHVFIGSNNALIAPVTIGAHSMTAAGSVITEDVPEHALAIARASQVNKEGYATKLRGSMHVSGAVRSHGQVPEQP